MTVSDCELGLNSHSQSLTHSHSPPPLFGVRSFVRSFDVRWRSAVGGVLTTKDFDVAAYVVAVAVAVAAMQRWRTEEGNTDCVGR